MWLTFVVSSRVFRRPLAALGCAVALAGCGGQPAEPQPTGSRPAPPDAAPRPPAPVAVQVLRSGPSLLEAFESVYGARGRVVRAGLDPERPDGAFAVTPAALAITSTHYLLVAQVRSYFDAEGAAGGDEEMTDAHVSMGGLAVHVFRNAGGRRGEVTAAAPFIAGGYGFGSPADWEIRTDLLGSPALFVQSGYQQMGCVVRYDVLYEPLIAVAVPRTEPILMMIEDPTQDRVEGRIDRAPGQDGFLVHYSGGLTRTVRYTRAGDRYVADTPRASLPDC